MCFTIHRAPTLGVIIATATETRATCGYCNTGHHQQCPVKIKRATKSTPDGTWTCPCPCTADRKPYCTLCKHTGEGEVGPKSWQCIDRSACDVRRTARLESNPLVQQMKMLKEKRMSQTATEKTEKKAAAPKTGTCLVTGKETKGGKFLPGMDARYVSERVNDVVSGKVTEEQAWAKIEKDDISDRLRAKFDRSLELAMQKKEKQEAAAQAAEAKKKAEADEKKAKAEAKKAEKAAKAEAESA